MRAATLAPCTASVWLREGVGLRDSPLFGGVCGDEFAEAEEYETKNAARGRRTRGEAAARSEPRVEGAAAQNHHNYGGRTPRERRSLLSVTRPSGIIMIAKKRVTCFCGEMSPKPTVLKVALMKYTLSTAFKPSTKQSVKYLQDHQVEQSQNEPAALNYL